MTLNDRVMGFIKDILSKFSCHHEWHVHAKSETYNSADDYKHRYPYRIEQILICKKCGKIKRIKI